jgi:hypothetical protein
MSHVRAQGFGSLGMMTSELITPYGPRHRHAAPPRQLRQPKGSGDVDEPGRVDLCVDAWATAPREP